MQQPLFFPADAHEGPVWVAGQCRLYFVTKPHPNGQRRVDIQYLDFSALGTQNAGELWNLIKEDAPRRVLPQVFSHDANLANSMCLAPDGHSLLIAEQGDDTRRGAISSLLLADKSRKILAEDYEGKPFNSPNKVITTRRGDLIFSDPDYAFRQSFGPPPELEPNIYLLKTTGELTCFRCNLKMPHGLALSPDETTLFISDTSNEGVHGDDIQLNREKSVWRFDFLADTATISGSGEFCFDVDEGVPDGMITTGDRLLVGGGDGVYVSDLSGKLVGKIPTPYTAVNLSLAADGQHLFVTAEHGVLLFLNWRSFVRDSGIEEANSDTDLKTATFRS